MTIISTFLTVFKNLWPMLLLLIIFVAIVSFIKQKKNPDEKSESLDDYKYYVKRKYYMSEAEHNFFKVLQEVVKDKYFIIPQVQFSKIVEVNKYEKFKQKYLNKIDRKSVDFVLFDKEHFSPQIAIELDETSHLLPENEKKDKFKDDVLNRVGIKIVRIKTAYNYNLNDILEKL